MLLEYENLIKLLNDVTKGDFFNDYAIIEKYKRSIGKFKIPKELLEKLNNEQSRIIKIGNRETDEIEPVESSFQYSFEFKGTYATVYFSN